MARHCWSYGGEGGIRTHGTVTRTLDFESSPFGHSGTSPPRSLAAAADERQRQRQRRANFAPLHPVSFLAVAAGRRLLYRTPSVLGAGVRAVIAQKRVVGRLSAAALRERWRQMADDPLLRAIPYKLELNEKGSIEVSPATPRHALLQSLTATELRRSLPARPSSSVRSRRRSAFESRTWPGRRAIS